MTTLYRQKKRTLHVTRMQTAWVWVREIVAALACMGLMFGGVIVAGLLA